MQTLGKIGFLLNIQSPVAWGFPLKIYENFTPPFQPFPNHDLDRAFQNAPDLLHGSHRRGHKTRRGGLFTFTCR
jgi:hypothetical protein